MKPFCVTILLFSVLDLISCSFGSLLSSVPGTGQETTNGIIAVVRYSNGAPAAGVVVRLRRSDYVKQIPSLAKSPADSANTLTDSSGRFEFHGITPGDYCIEASSCSSSVLFSCSLDANDTINLGANSLRPFAAIIGAIDSLKSPAYAQIHGLERLVPVDNSGRFAFTDLPQGILNVRIARTDAPSTAFEISNVKTTAGDTTAVLTDAGWRFSRRIYLNTTKTGAGAMENVVDFPLLVRFSGGNFDFSQARDSGQDIRFFRSDGANLSYEIAIWDKQNRIAAVWVKIDTVIGNSDSQFVTMAWGNTTALSASNSKSMFDTSTGWTGVWHLEENGSGVTGEFRDATLYGSNGAGGNGVAAQTPSRVAGVVGSAQMFDGSNDFIQVPDHPGLNFADQMTALFWFYYDSIQSYNARILSKDMDWDVKIVSGRPQLSIGGAYYLADASFLQNAWNYVTVTLSGLSGVPAPAVYLNGRPCAMFENTFPDSFATASRNPAGDLFFGQLGNNSYYLHGAIDEIWLQRTARPAAWIALNYENQRRGGTLLDIGR